MKRLDEIIETYETRRSFSNVKHVHVNTKLEGREIDEKINNVMR